MDPLVWFQQTLVLPCVSLPFSPACSTARKGHFSLSPAPISAFLLYSVCIKLKSHQLALQWLFQLKKKTHITALFPANFIHIFYVLVGVWAAANKWFCDFSSSSQIIQTFILSLEHSSHRFTFSASAKFLLFYAPHGICLILRLSENDYLQNGKSETKMNKPPSHSINLYSFLRGNSS